MSSSDNSATLAWLSGAFLGVAAGLHLSSYFEEEVNIDLSEKNSYRVEFGYCQDAAANITSALEEELNELGFTLSNDQVKCLAQ